MKTFCRCFAMQFAVELFVWFILILRDLITLLLIALAFVRSHFYLLLLLSLDLRLSLSRHCLLSPPLLLQNAHIGIMWKWKDLLELNDANDVRAIQTNEKSQCIFHFYSGEFRLFFSTEFIVPSLALCVNHSFIHLLDAILFLYVNSKMNCLARHSVSVCVCAKRWATNAARELIKATFTRFISNILQI